MNNASISKVLDNIAELLELKGENVFKVRAYQRAARTLEGLPVEAAQLHREGRLRQVPGIGEALEKKIAELLTTGRLEYYDKLRAEFPPGIETLMEVPGIGPKTAVRLSRELGITTLEQLEEALLAGRVASLPQMGQKSAENILRHLQSLRRKETRIPIGQALPVVESILQRMRQVDGLWEIVPAGSLRRFKETIGDIDLMATARDPASISQAFVSLPQVREVLVHGPTKSSIVVEGGLQVDLRLVEPDSFGAMLQYFTGSKEHNILLRERGNRMGLKLSEYGITLLETEALEKYRDEDAFYARLGLPFIPPELREGRDEIERAERGEIPHLLQVGDLKGDLHAHTDWSDGHDPLEDMARAAQSAGYGYLATTDHSSGRGVARGLKPERLRAQMEEIRRINAGLTGFRLLSGAEVDIRADGSLDFPDELLSELDIVVAAVHSAMGQDREVITRRIIKALEDPHVDILAHPSTRLLGERDPVDADWEQVFQAARRTGAALEINAMPQRLDLKDSHVYRARELGVKLVISTDSHDTTHLGLARFGVGVARRGWCQAGDILNTLPVDEMLALLHNR